MYSGNKKIIQNYPYSSDLYQQHDNEIAPEPPIGSGYWIQAPSGDFVLQSPTGDYVIIGA